MINIKVKLKMVNVMEKVFIHGMMVPIMLAIGLIIKEMVTVFIHLLMLAINMKAIGTMILYLKVNVSILIVIDMMEILRITCQMDMVQ